MTDQPTSAVQDYLKAIHRLGGGEGVVLPNDIAKALGVKAPSVTGMLKRLADAGWIEYTSGTGAKLSATGLAEALELVVFSDGGEGDFVVDLADLMQGR